MKLALVLYLLGAFMVAFLYTDAFRRSYRPIRLLIGAILWPLLALFYFVVGVVDIAAGWIR